MEKKSKKSIIGIAVLITVLIIQVILMMYSVHSLQGNGRVVNYAGIVRGATQRLVKNELYGNQRDEEISRLDDILLGLQTGEGRQNLTVLNDKEYLEKLKILADNWEAVKADIYAAREDETKKDNLYESSENYFVLADETVSAAEAYSDGIAKKTSALEVSISINILLIVILFIGEILMEVKKNHNLNKIAYIDPQTGLPNKRACEERISDSTPIGAEQKVCFLMFDLNNLKTINDTLGHEAGDALICTFASLLRRNMPDNMFVGRFGGDEFIGIHMNADEKDIEAGIERLKKECGQTEKFESINYMKISFAYGSAYSTEQNNYLTMKALMNIADKKMYINKAKTKKENQRREKYEE